MSRSAVVILIVLGLALLGLLLLRAQPQSTADSAVQEGAASCLTLCPLPGEGAGVRDAGQFFTGPAGAECLTPTPASSW